VAMVLANGVLQNDVAMIGQRETTIRIRTTIPVRIITRIRICIMVCTITEAVAAALVEEEAMMLLEPVVVAVQEEEVAAVQQQVAVDVAAQQLVVAAVAAVVEVDVAEVVAVEVKKADIGDTSANGRFLSSETKNQPLRSFGLWLAVDGPLTP
jgi:hypothetical protein